MQVADSRPTDKVTKAVCPNKRNTAGYMIGRWHSIRLLNLFNGMLGHRLFTTSSRNDFHTHTHRPTSTRTPTPTPTPTPEHRVSLPCFSGATSTVFFKWCHLSPLHELLVRPFRVGVLPAQCDFQTRCDIGRHRHRHRITDTDTDTDTDMDTDKQEALCAD